MNVLAPIQFTSETLLHFPAVLVYPFAGRSNLDLPIDQTSSRPMKPPRAERLGARMVHAVMRFTFGRMSARIRRWAVDAPMAVTFETITVVDELAGIATTAGTEA